jgi:hypothetical protein
MATGTDRDAPSREATPEVPNQTQEPTPAPEPGVGPTVRQSVAAGQEKPLSGAEVAKDRRVYPTDQPKPSLGWTDRGGMVEQQASAMAWVKASHEQRQNETQEVGPDAPEQQRDEHARELPFFEGRSPRTSEGFKIEHAEAVNKEAEEGKAKPEGQEKSLTFFEDRNPELIRTR